MAFLAIRNVAEDDDATGNIIIQPLPDRRDAMLDVHLTVTAAQEKRVIAKRTKRTLRESLGHAIGGENAGRLIDDIEDGGVGLSESLGMRPPGQHFRRGVKESDAPFGVGRDHGVGDAREGGREP
jgi:hypothetical protein